MPLLPPVRSFLVALAVLFGWAWGLLASGTAHAACDAAAPDQPFQATLMTTSPGDEVFSAFGHTALRISGGGLARPLVLDWGTFSTRGQNPLLAFLRGTIDYSLKAVSEDQLMRRAHAGERSLVAQRLDLPPDVAARLLADLDAALAVDDRRFRYDWLRDNCATRVRDALDRATDGSIHAQASIPGQWTVRDEVLRHVGAPARGPGWWPLWLGFATALSDQDDLRLDSWSRMFLPDRLMEEARTMSLSWPDGSSRPLVAEECLLVQGEHDFLPDPAPRRLLPLLGLGLGWAALVAAGAWRPARAVGFAASALLILVLVAVGIITSGLFLFTSVTGAGTNEVWWVASPLSLLLVLAWTSAPRKLVAGVLAGLLLLAAIGLLRQIPGLAGQDALPPLLLLCPPLFAFCAVNLARLRGR